MRFVLFALLRRSGAVEKALKQCLEQREFKE
jgi:hypothetical protein